MGTFNWMVGRIMDRRVSRVETRLGSVHVALTRFQPADQVTRVRRNPPSPAFIPLPSPHATLPRSHNRRLSLSSRQSAYKWQTSRKTWDRIQGRRASSPPRTLVNVMSLFLYLRPKNWKPRNTTEASFPLFFNPLSARG